MNEKQLELLKKELETTKGMIEFYEKQMETNSNKTLENFVNHYKGKLEGLENVFYILGIDYVVEGQS